MAVWCFTLQPYLTLIFASFGRLLSDNSMKGASKMLAPLDFSGCVMCVKLALCNTNHKIVFQSICLGHVDVIPFTDLTQ